MKKILFVIILSIFSNSVFAAELWQGLKSGATSQEIIRKFPSAHDNGYKSLVMNDYMVFEKNFTVNFRMSDGKLKSVHLDTQFTKYDLLYSKALNALSLKYGEPSESFSTSLGKLTRWDYNGVEISLLDQYSSNSVFINYHTDLVDNSNKL